MKKGKYIAILLIVFAACFLSGCAQEISGSIDTVVEQCQELPTDANVTITVSGEKAPYWPTEKSDSGGLLFAMQSDSGNWVNAFFDDVTDDDLRKLRSSSRLTISGTLKPDWTHYDSITIDNCKIK